MPLLMFLNVMPLAAAWGLDSNYSNYEAGHFDAVASENMGAWLGWSFLVASIMCQLGLLNSTMMAAQRMLYYFLQTRYPKTFGEHAITAGRSKLFIYLWVDPTPGVPAGLILANGCVALLAQVYLSMIDETEIFGIPYFKMVCFFVTIGGGGLVHLVYDVRRAGDESSMLFAHQDNPAEEVPKGQTFRKLYS
eukprot:gene6785-23795_t